MVIVGNGHVLSGGVKGRGSGVRVMGERQWGFVLVVREVHDMQTKMWEEVMVGKSDVVFCFVGPSFMFVWVLLLRWGIGDRSRR